MGSVELRAYNNVTELVALAQGSDEPLIVCDGDDECLIAMRPAVFERILFDGNLLNCMERESLHF